MGASAPARKQTPRKTQWRASPELRALRKQALSPLFGEVTRQGRRRTWLAEQLGVSRAALWNYEHGMVRIPQDVLIATCNLIGFSRDQLEAASPILLIAPEQIMQFGGPEKRAS